MQSSGIGNQVTTQTLIGNNRSVATIATTPVVKNTSDTGQRILPTQRQFMSSQRGSKAPKIEQNPSSTSMNNTSSAARVITTPIVNNSPMAQQPSINSSHTINSPKPVPKVPTPTISKPTSSPVLSSKLPETLAIEGKSYKVQYMTPERAAQFNEFVDLFQAGGMAAVDNKIAECGRIIENSQNRVTQLVIENEMHAKNEEIARQSARESCRAALENFTIISSSLNHGKEQLSVNWLKTRLPNTMLEKGLIEIQKVIDLIDTYFVKYYSDVTSQELISLGKVILIKAQSADQFINKIQVLKV